LGDAPALLPASVGKPIGLPVLVTFVSEGIWRLARHISVIAHEGAHALAGRSMGRKVVGVRLNSDATGETASQGPAVGPHGSEAGSSSDRLGRQPAHVPGLRRKLA